MATWVPRPSRPVWCGPPWVEDMPIPVILLLIVESERWLSSTIMVTIMRLGGKLVTVGGCLSPPRPTRGPTRRGGTRRVLLWFRTPILLGPCFKGKLVQLHPYVTQERAWPLGYDRYSGAWRYPVVFRTPTSGHASSLCRACDSSHHLRVGLPTRGCGGRGRIRHVCLWDPSAAC